MKYANKHEAPMTSRQIAAKWLVIEQADKNIVIGKEDHALLQQDGASRLFKTGSESWEEALKNRWQAAVNVRESGSIPETVQAFGDWAVSVRGLTLAVQAIHQKIPKPPVPTFVETNRFNLRALAETAAQEDGKSTLDWKIDDPEATMYWPLFRQLELPYVRGEPCLMKRTYRALDLQRAAVDVLSGVIAHAVSEEAFVPRPQLPGQDGLKPMNF